MKVLTSCIAAVLFVVAAPFPVFSQPYVWTTVSIANLTPANQPANLNFAQSVAVDRNGNLFIADSNDNRIIKVTPAGNATVVAGLGPIAPCCYGGDGGLATNATLNRPTGVSVDSHGNVFFADSGNNRIRMFPVGGNINTVAGTGVAGFFGDGGQATSAQVNNPNGVAVDLAGNVYIADTNNSRIRMIAAATGIITTVAGANSPGFSGDGGAAIGAQLNFPQTLAVDTAGNEYIADTNNGRVRKVTGGKIVTVAGGGIGCCSPYAVVPATSVDLQPWGVALDSSGNLYISDSFSNSVDEVLAANGYLTTIFPVNGPAQPFLFIIPRGLAVDSELNLYVADITGNRVLKATFSTLQVGPAGNGLVQPLPIAAPPGGIAEVPVTVNLTPGQSLDSIAVVLQIAPPAGGPLSFTPNNGTPVPELQQGGATSLDIVYAGQLGPLSGTVPLGAVNVPVSANAPIGTNYTLSILAVAGGLTGQGGAVAAVPLGAVWSSPNITVANPCSYLGGDTYPGTAVTTQCAQFGDGQFLNVTFQDVIQALRWWAAVPGSGWDTLSVCTDLWDAFNTFPEDTPQAIGGDPNPTAPYGNDPVSRPIADVLVTLNRWAGLEPVQPWFTRPSGSYTRFPACAAGVPPLAITGQVASAHADRNAQPAHFTKLVAPGAVELGVVESGSGVNRVPVYLRASRALTSVAFSIGFAGSSAAKLTFSKANVGAPALLDTEVPGVVTAAWFQNLPATAGQRVLLGYLEWDLSDGAAPAQLQVYKVEANANSSAH